MVPALLIMGPTASGKSALALALAESLGCEIINADSMQVYRDFRILTARPTPEEETQAPHRLYGHVDAASSYSTGLWLEQATAAIEEAAAQGRRPIVVGGAGLYFKALTQGLAEIPAASPDLRAALRARAAREGAPALHAELTKRDPETARRLEPKDAPRILRALEVLETTGESIATLQAQTKPALARPAWRGLVLTPPRAALYAAIDARFERMIAAGALEEVKTLAERELDPALPAMKAHGAPALMAHLRGEMSLEEAVAFGQRDTRRYAKRQFTWIAHQMQDWPRVSETEIGARLAAAEAVLAQR